MFNFLIQSYWRDEAFSVMFSSRPLKDLFALIVSYDHAPPLFTYLQHFWIGFFGLEEVSVRLLSFLFHLLTAYFVYKLTKSKFIGLIAVLSPFLWFYAWEARQYSTYTALILGGVYFYSVSKIWPSIIFWSLALLSHNFAWIYFGTFLLLTRDKRLLPAFIPGLVWLPFLWQQISRVSSGMWLESLTGLWWWQSLKIFLVSDANYPIRPVLLILSLVLLVLGLRKPNRLYWLALFPPILTYVISKLWQPLYLERYLLPSLPLLIAAIGINLKKVKLIKLLAVVYIIVAAIAITQISGQQTKPAMKQAVNQIVSQAQSEDIIVTEQPINYLEVYFYLQQSGNESRLYSYLYPGENEIPYYVGTYLIKPWQEIVTIPENKTGWLIKPDASVVRK